MNVPDRYFIIGGDIMDLSGLITFIQTLGFPIACVCYLFYSTAKERESHAAESKAWTDALHNNTLAIQHLTDIISERFKNPDEKKEG